jgi:hypothetical protein
VEQEVGLGEGAAALREFLFFQLWGFVRQTMFIENLTVKEAIMMVWGQLS